MGILYPAALAADGKIVFIKAAMAGNKYACLHCEQRMVARKGARKAHHFAHWRAGDCELDSALHTYAQRIIQDGHATADQYVAEFQCRGCEEWIGKDVKDYNCIKEANLVKGARSDIAFVKNAHRRLAVEIVVTHDMEPPAVSAYRSDNIPVMIVQPTWETLEDLYRRVRADDVLNIEPFCKSCKNARQAERARREKIESKAKLAYQTQMDAIREMCNTNKSGVSFTTWHRDKFHRPMYRPVKDSVHASAQLLTNRGWEQRNPKKPWLFQYDLPFTVAFADFGGTDVIPIYDDTAALVYVFASRHKPQGFQALPEEFLALMLMEIRVEVMRAMESFGVPARESFFHDRDELEYLGYNTSIGLRLPWQNNRKDEDNQ